jgi:hypothetical protein
MAQGAWYRFWQPELGWLNEANMTNYRSLNAMRIAVAIVVAGIAAFLGSVGMFWRSVWIAGHIHEAQIVSAVLMSGKEAAGFAGDVLEGLLWFAGAIGGFAVGGAIGKRLTDTEHRVKVEQAKKAPIVMPMPSTQEHAAPQQQTTVNVGETSVEATEAKHRQRPTGNALEDDERGEV